MTPTDQARPPRARIGGVPYGVGARLVAGLEQLPGTALSRQVPSQLADSLRQGQLDAALVSSIEGFRQPGLAALADLGICCRGAVGSVRAFRRGTGPIRSVGLDTSSETSVALLRILLDGPLAAAADCRFERVAPTLVPGELPHDLVLLIGDPGLHADPGDRQPLDLGALWHDWTGLPFVFALWLIHPAADAGFVAATLREVWERNRDLPRRDDEAQVHYRLGTDEHAGLRRFAAEARRLGFAPPDVEPRWID